MRGQPQRRLFDAVGRWQVAERRYQQLAAARAAEAELRALGAYMERLTAQARQAREERRDMRDMATTTPRPRNLRLVERHDTYNTYRQPGSPDLVHLMNGPHRLSERQQRYRLLDIKPRQLSALANDFIRANRYAYLEDFRNSLTRQVVDPENIHLINACNICGTWTRTRAKTANYDRHDYTGWGTKQVCDSCIQAAFGVCPYCPFRQNVHYNPMRPNGTGPTHCAYHFDEYWTTCARCRQHVRRNRQHNCGCGCESAEKTFEIRNGDGTIANDQIVQVTLPAGQISDVGMKQIERMITDYFYTVYLRADRAYTYRDDETKTARIKALQEYTTIATAIDQRPLREQIGDMWNGNDGNFTKRLSRWAYKLDKIKLPPDLLTQIGNVGADQSKGATFRVEFTRELNQPARAFLNGGSCWWGGYSDSRCTFKSYGGFALRTFDDRGQPVGRAWVLPMQKTANGRLAPTLEVLNADAYIVFNGYGDLGGYAPARILAGMTGLVYQKIQFYNDNPRYLYVNSTAGYLVAPQAMLINSYTPSLRPHGVPTPQLPPAAADFVLMA